MPVSFELREEFAIITLNRPQALNALNAEVIERLGRVFDDVARSDARALLIAGAGERAFCAGADIADLVDATALQHRDRMLHGQHVLGRLDALPQASVAVIDGFALGGGLELALACTFRVATPAARLGLPEVKLGLVPGYGGTQRLPRLIGESRALELVMTGRIVGAEEAGRIGLVDHIVDQVDPLGGAIAYARAFTQYGMPALRCGRAAVQAARDLDLGAGLRMEADISALAYGTANAREGMRAFLEKRKAVSRDE